MRVGQKNSLVYQWAKTGSRPRQPKDQRYENAYVFGAVCPCRDTGVALIMPQADTEAMQAHLDAIGRAVAPGAHALLILDKAGWHTTRKLKQPGNVTLVPLPPAWWTASNATPPVIAPSPTTATTWASSPWPWRMASLIPTA